MRLQIKNFIDSLIKAAAEFPSASASLLSLVTITNAEEIISKLHTALSLYETLPMKLNLEERQALSSEAVISALTVIHTVLERAKSYLRLLPQDTPLVSVFEFQTRFNNLVAEARVIQDEDEATVVITLEDKAVQALATVNLALGRAQSFASTAPVSAIPEANASVARASSSCSLPPLPQAVKLNSKVSDL